jgi:hypothetical protein
VSAEIFARTFVEEFCARAQREGQRFSAMWREGGPAWTALMVHAPDQDSVLARTLKLWRLEIHGDDRISLHHWYTVDLMAIAPPLQTVTDYWDTSPVALVEHENAKDIETELWKLAHWRAPLKVLVFYRLANDPWLDRKFEQAQRIVAAAQSPLAEIGVEYLLLAGCREKQRVSWRAETWRNGHWSRQTHNTDVFVGD